MYAAFIFKNFFVKDETMFITFLKADELPSWMVELSF